MYSFVVTIIVTQRDNKCACHHGCSSGATQAKSHCPMSTVRFGTVSSGPCLTWRSLPRHGTALSTLQWIHMPNACCGRCDWRGFIPCCQDVVLCCRWQFHCPLGLDMWEAEGDRKTIARRERKQSFPCIIRCETVSFRLQKNCNREQLWVVNVFSYTIHAQTDCWQSLSPFTLSIFFSPLTVTLHKFFVVLRPL
jgi:hypothetical protein